MLSVEFVATPDPDAEVRCALHDPDARVYVADGALDLGVADFQGSPGGVGGDDGYRRITVTVTVVSDEWSARRFQSALARELLRAENYLRVQFSEDTPVVWFHTWRTTPGPMDLQAVDSGIWQFTVQADADAYSLGEFVQQGLTLSNHPFDGGVAVVLDDTIGDAPAPLLISGIDSDGQMYRPMIAVTPLSEWAGLQVWDSTSLVGVPGAFDESDAEAFGGMAKGLQPGWSVTASVVTEQAGTYRLFARVRNTTTSSTLTAGGAAAVKPRATSALPTSGHYYYFDMGTYAFPRGNAPLAPGYTLTPVGGDTTEVTLRFDDTTGGLSAPEVYVSGLVAVPVELFESVGESRMMMLGTNNSLLGQRIDGDLERIGPIPAPNPITARDADQLIGDFPRVTPGAVNVLHLLTKVQGNDTAMADLSEPLSETVTLNLKYRPRWLYQASE